MGWVDDSGAHEGWVANLLADGRTGAGVCAQGVLVDQAIPHDLVVGRDVLQLTPNGRLSVIIPWDEVTTWQVRCDCGWAGSRRPAQQADDEPGYRGCDGHPDTEAAFKQEWAAHVAPHAATVEIDRLATQVRALQADLNTAVHRARTAGISWAHIGAATGLSKQGAQQRWGKNDN